MFISSFRPESQSIDKINIRNTASFFLNSLSEYCETHNKNFCVAKVYSRLDKMHYSKSYHQKENNFIKNNAKKFHTENIDSYIQSLHTKIKQLENNLPTDQQKPDFVKPLNHIIQGFSEIISQIDHL